MENSNNKINNNPIYSEIFDTFLSGGKHFANPFRSFAAIETCNIIAMSLIALDGNATLNDIAKYDSQGKILSLRKRLELSDNPDKNNIIPLLDIMRAFPVRYYTDVFDFIITNIKKKSEK